MTASAAATACVAVSGRRKMAAADVEEPGLGDFSSLFETYSAACRTGAGVHDGSDAEFEEGVERVREHLLSASGEAAACMICLESIRPQDPVWSCQQGCHAVMHLPCIQSWSRRTLVAAQEKAAGHPGQPPSAAARGPVCWGCPKCRQDYLTVPSGYSCWCGKVADPEWNPWNAAHSCGERCERPAPGCAHPCMLLCHPGSAAEIDFCAKRVQNLLLIGRVWQSVGRHPATFTDALSCSEAAPDLMCC